LPVNLSFTVASSTIKTRVCDCSTWFAGLPSNFTRRVWGIGSCRFLRIWQHEVGANAANPATDIIGEQLNKKAVNSQMPQSPSDGMTS
jgi:hypothetical protein